MIGRMLVMEVMKNKHWSTSRVKVDWILRKAILTKDTKEVANLAQEMLELKTLDLFRYNTEVRMI